MKIISSYLDSHFHESFTIHEEGMKLTPEHNSKIRVRLESLESRAPAISATHLKFTNENNEIKGELSIIGTGKSFRSEIRGQDPWKIYKSLEMEIDKQLVQWKKMRFLNKSVGLPISKKQRQLKGSYAV